jgi:hypothetical protein
MCDEHTRDLFALEEDDDATLVLDDGSELEATVTGKMKRASPDDKPNIWEQSSVYLETADGLELTAIIVDGQGNDDFPSHSELQEVPGPQGEESIEDIHGYVTEVRQ